MKTLLLTFYHRPYLFMSLFALIFITSFMFAKQLKVDADLSALLPQEIDSIKDFERVKTRFGGIGYIVVTATGDKPENLRRFADNVANVVKHTPHISFVDSKRPSDFFRNRGFYYLEVDDLKTIEERLKLRWKWEKRQKNPMYIDLEESEPPSLDFQDLRDKHQKSQSKWWSAQQSDETYYFNQDDSRIAIFIKPDITSLDLDFSQRVINDVQQQLNKIDYSSYSPNLKVELTGSYQKKIDMQKSMKIDLKNVSLIALSLVFIYLLIHFRRLEPVVLILLPLILGIACTFAFAQLVFSQLNILTAFIGVILIGLGIDHGIHLLSRYQDECKSNADAEKVMRNTFLQTGRAVTIATLTTFVTFVSLSLSDFRAFHEFGIIAAAGMIFISLAYLIFLPPLLKIVKQHSWKIVSDENVIISSNRVTKGLLHRPKQRIILASIVWLVFTIFATQVYFNYDFESLGNSDLRSFQLDKEVNALLGYSQTPMVVLTENTTEEKRAASQLRDNKNQLAENSGLDFVLTADDLVPPLQTEKQIEIEKIGKILNRMKASWFEPAEVEKLETAKQMVDVAPFTYDDLPEQMKKLFGINEHEKSQDGIILLFPSIGLGDGDKVLSLTEEIRQVRQSDDKRLIIAGEALVLADILRLVFTELPFVLLLSLILIIAVLWIFLKDLTMTMLCLIPAVMTLSITLGIMAILGIELNYINVLMLPVLLGISVDSGVHIVTRVMDGDSLHKIIKHTGLAIWGSIITSGLGVGAMLLTNHHGLNTLAQVGTIGLLVNLIVSVAVLPALLSLFKAKKYFNTIHH